MSTIEPDPNPLAEPLAIFHKKLYVSPPPKVFIVSEYDIVRGSYSERFTRYMGMLTINIQDGNTGAVMQVQKEYPIDAATIEEAFDKAEAEAKRWFPVLQKEIQAELYANSRRIQMPAGKHAR